MLYTLRKTRGPRWITALFVLAVATLGFWLFALAGWTVRHEPAPLPRFAVAFGMAASCIAIFALWSLYRSERQLRAHLAEADVLAARALEMLRLKASAGPSAGASPLITDRLHEIIAQLGSMLEEYRQREREVLRSDQLALVGQMAAGVAHEIRNPLTSIKMLLQSGQKGGGDGLSDEDLRIIEQESRRIERSLQRFLDFARPPRPERRPLELAPLVAQAMALIEGRARKQRVALRRQIPDKPVVVNADRDQLQQLVLNLLINALDVMPDGGELSVRLSHDQDQAELQVEDTGPGIPAELMPRLFDPFVSTKETGVGLGLAVSYRIAEQHAGRLWAKPDRAPDTGACLVLNLPLLNCSIVASEE